MKKIVVIVLDGNEFEQDDYVCKCGNTSASDGFYPCNSSGREIEPDENWQGLYVCARCGGLTMIEFR